MFEKAWDIFKVLIGFWSSSSNQIWIRSFKWDTVSSCRSRDCKNIGGQSWKSQRKVQTWTQCAQGQLNWQIFYLPSNLTFDIFAASLPTRAYNTSFENSDSYLFGDWKPGPWHDFWCDLCLLKVPLFHIIQRSLLKQKLAALYQNWFPSFSSLLCLQKIIRNFEAFGNCCKEV